MQLCEFGEQVWVKAMRAQGRRGERAADLDSRWRKGTWLGAHDRSNEHMVAIEEGGPALTTFLGEGRFVLQTRVRGSQLQLLQAHVHSNNKAEDKSEAII